MMKKILSALFAVLIAAGAAQAAPIKFGVKAGMNVNKLKFNKDLASSDNSCGWTAGVMADFTVPIIGIGCDVSLMYARMNNASDVTYAIPNNPSSSILSGAAIGDPALKNESIYGKNFLEIPVNIKYKFGIPVVGNILKPYIFTGPNFAFRLGKSIQDDVHGLKSRTCQIAWNVGLGLELINHLQVGASYGFGINNVVDKLTDQVTTADFKVKNNYWTVTAAYLF